MVSDLVEDEGKSQDEDGLVMSEKENNNGVVGFTASRNAA